MPETTRPARGMRDFLPEEVRRREHVIRIVGDVYRRYGFEPLETPALENIETLTGKYGEEGNKLIFKVLRRGEHEASGETDLALRYDLTVPLARVVAEHRGKLPKFFKRYQIQPVWRADRPARGRFREFYQCDVDAIGSRSMVVETELCAAVSDVLQALGFSDFVIKLNHRRVLTGLLDASDVPQELHDSALVALDKLDKIGVTGVQQELEARGVSNPKFLQIFQELTALQWPAFERDEANRAVLQKLRSTLRHSPGSADGILELEDLVRLSSSTSAGPHIQLDVTLARGLSYYTGAIMEIADPKLRGSLGGGGRYDDLIGMFLGEQVPACGFSLGLERILVVMTENDMFPADVQSAAADVLVTLFEGQPVEDALALARDLRGRGMRVEVYPEPDKLGKQFKYASARGVPLVTILGSDERAQQAVTIKNMNTGEQVTRPQHDVADYLHTARRGNA
jgi:histidyl-tRNA synthetase